MQKPQAGLYKHFFLASCSSPNVDRLDESLFRRQNYGSLWDGLDFCIQPQQGLLGREQMKNEKASQHLQPEPISRQKEKYFPRPFVERQLFVAAS